MKQSKLDGQNATCQIGYDSVLRLQLPRHVLRFRDSHRDGLGRGLTTGYRPVKPRFANALLVSVSVRPAQL
jgi:hypothetical protein